MVTLTFPGTSHAPVEVPAAAELSLYLTVMNSPVLFGCRTGLCGTCACLVEGDLPPPGPEELEVLEAFVDGLAGARLVCQLRPERDVAIRTLPEPV
jgi:ferredoxin